jgi:hypothetical protein
MVYSFSKVNIPALIFEVIKIFPTAFNTPTFSGRTLLPFKTERLAGNPGWQGFVLLLLPRLQSETIPETDSSIKAGVAWFWFGKPPHRLGLRRSFTSGRRLSHG